VLRRFARASLRQLRSWWCALGFLTRLPAPAVALDEQTVARSAGFFSWVGLLLGGLLWALAEPLRRLGEPLAALSLLALWTWLTGAFHLDGLADMVDGFSGGRGDRQRTLEIMRDSRIGSHGACALVLALALKGAGLLRARELGIEAVWLVPGVARFGCTVLLARFPYARSVGMGSAFAGRVGARELLLGALGLALPLFLWPAAQSAAYAVALLGGLASSLALAIWAARRLGGLTGDVHGAAVELSEIAALIALCAVGLR
jgi:adenosylcobinamide-GDP ribazoletransferase